MPKKSEPKVYCENPKPGAQGCNIAKDKYQAMRKAILKHVPRRKEGTPFGGLLHAVTELVQGEVFAGASISWYLTVVKLDLEAKGLIERVPRKSPQHLRRC